MAKKPVLYDPAVDLDLIRKKLKHLRFSPSKPYVMDTGSPQLNAVFGNSEGIYWKKLYEISGRPSGGKSTLATEICRMAQQDGAYTGWMDVENSMDRKWFERRGVDYDRIAIFDQYAGEFQDAKKKTETRIAMANDMCSEAEEYMQLLHSRSSDNRFILFVDSVTGFLNEVEAGYGLQQKMNSEQSLPKFLGRLCRRWVGYAAAYNAVIVFINQIRVNPAEMFGDPEYTPGGNAIPFYSHVRLKVNRSGEKKGRIISAKTGLPIGIKGEIINVKTKVGGVEGVKASYKFFFSGKSVYGDAKVKKTNAKSRS